MDRPARAASGAIEAATAVLGELAEPGAALGARTTYRVGGPAALGVTARSLDDLRCAAEAHRASGLPLLNVGNGSNMLVADRGFEGIALWTAIDPERFELERGSGAAEVCRVVVDASMPLPMLARRSVAAGLAGLEWAVGVPGTVGGAVRMNAGGHGSDTSLLVSSVRVFSAASGEVRELRHTELEFGYRTSVLTDDDVVLDATFEVDDATDGHDGDGLLREIVRWRRDHQPGGQNAGSVFVNPDGDSAGAIIERLGLKGHRIGTAEVSPKHANFIQADPDGSGDDVARLIDFVAQSVRAETGIVLRTEIRRVGFDLGGDAPLGAAP